ncbi:hypothetical protein NXW97_24390 [Bacteroides faecis]|uniref:Uncharacterized protein n=1 Tax=Bacteroides faecis TaxID=674529 RepID=A0AAW5P2U1_9BACE|nr:hypothetical protein [Bacteroides faecis]MCS2795089.1 hypothetical protein [Bacteroides faecis]
MGKPQPTFLSSILDGANWTGRQLELYVGGKDGYMDFSPSASQDYVRTSTTGYIFRKFMDESDNINYVDIESTSYWIGNALCRDYSYPFQGLCPFG